LERLFACCFPTDEVARAAGEWVLHFFTKIIHFSPNKRFFGQTGANAESIERVVNFNKMKSNEFYHESGLD
jgi:hypothetical protein